MTNASTESRREFGNHWNGEERLRRADVQTGSGARTGVLVMDITRARNSNHGKSRTRHPIELLEYKTILPRCRRTLNRPIGIEHVRGELTSDVLDRIPNAFRGRNHHLRLCFLSSHRCGSMRAISHRRGATRPGRDIGSTRLAITNKHRFFLIYLLCVSFVRSFVRSMTP